MKIPEQAPVGWCEWLGQRAIMARGWAVIGLNRVRKRMGRSYYGTEDPFTAGLFGNSYTQEQVLRTLRIPPVMAPGWQRVGTIPCISGVLAATDPIYFPDTEGEYRVRAAGIVPGAHSLELQRVQLRRPYGQTVLRARVLWADAGNDPDFECCGGVGVDLGCICLYDPHFVAHLTPEDLQARGFDPIDLMGKADYQNLDPARVGRAFFHVFSSGFGDGYYPVFRVFNGGRLVGILVDMTGMLHGNGVPHEGMKVVSVQHRAT